LLLYDHTYTCCTWGMIHTYVGRDSFICGTYVHKCTGARAACRELAGENSEKSAGYCICYVEWLQEWLLRMNFSRFSCRLNQERSTSDLAPLRLQAQQVTIKYMYMIDKYIHTYAHIIYTYIHIYIYTLYICICIYMYPENYRFSSLAFASTTGY